MSVSMSHPLEFEQETSKRWHSKPGNGSAESISTVTLPLLIPHAEALKAKIVIQFVTPLQALEGWIDMS